VFEERDIKVEVKVPERVAPVRGDVDRIIQVLLNLLSNAAKFCEAGRGRIEIALSQHGGTLRVDVRDNGPGIDASDQKVIFDKFRQVGDTLTAKPYGSGLGLHISRRIVEHFGGRLWVESSRGYGACFSFTLPHE
jgi:signal transduction histidine kinase